MPDDAAFCPGCGRGMGASLHAQGKIGPLPENIAGALAYFTFVPAILFLVIDPYKRSRFARFHSVQCLALWVVCIVVGIGLRLLDWMLLIVPVIGQLLVVLVSTVVSIAFFVLWLVLVVKALQGEAFVLPLVGSFAEQQANPV